MRKTDKQNRIKTTLMALAIAAMPLAATSPAHAAGLGKITVLSALGQPLRAELEISATKDEAQSVVAKIASADAFRQAGIEYAGALGTLRFSRDIKERNGRRYIELTSDRPLNEPFIDMLVELSWASGRLVREYTFLLDPPDLLPKTEPVAVTAPEVKTAPQTTAASAGTTPAAATAAGTATTAPDDARPAVARRAPVKSAIRAGSAASGATEKLVSGNAGEHKVVAGETLGKIAAQARPEGVSLDQMLVALFRSNSEAFDGANMNRLKAGKILAIPDAESASKVPAEEARKEIVAQASDFNAYRKKLADMVKAEPAPAAQAKQSVSGKIAPKVTESAPPVATGKDKLEVSRNEAAKDKDGKIKPLQGRISALEEDLVARDRALKEANSRVAALEKNINDLKKLAEIKSKGGAELEKQAQAAKPVAEAPKPPPPAPAQASPAQPTPATPPVAVPAEASVAKPAEIAKPAETTPPAAAAPAAPAVPPPPPKKKPLPPPEPEPEPSFVEENMPLVFGGGAILALLFGWLGLSAYRKKKAASAESTIAEGDLSAHSVFSSTTIAPPPSEQEPSEFSATGINLASAGDTVDPVVEADTFLAFGRDAQAEQILIDAMKVDAQRIAIPLKLLDIYAARKAPGQFEEIARTLHAITGGVGSDWEKVATMGAALDPGNALYGASPAAAPEPVVQSAPDFGATMIMSAAPVAAAAAAVVPSLIDVAPESAPVVPAAPEDSGEAMVLDFDLDLDVAEPAVAAATDTLSSVPDFGNAEVAALDIDFDMPAAAPAETLDVSLDEPLALDLGDIAAPVAQAAAESAGDDKAGDDGNSIDFEFDLGDAAPAADPEPASMPAPMAESAAPLALDVELDFELPAASAPAVADLAMPGGIDLTGISLDLDEATAPAVEAVLPDADASSAADALPENPEVATKLELALAYEEMGDRDGARELYQEALNEGSPGQQAAARAKLDALG